MASDDDDDELASMRESISARARAALGPEAAARLRELQAKRDRVTTTNSNQRLQPQSSSQPPRPAAFAAPPPRAPVRPSFKGDDDDEDDDGPQVVHPSSAGEDFSGEDVELRAAFPMTFGASVASGTKHAGSSKGYGASATDVIEAHERNRFDYFIFAINLYGGTKEFILWL
jgi:hypothetical protein